MSESQIESSVGQQTPAITPERIVEANYLEGQIVVEPLHGGLINSTYRVEHTAPEGTGTARYILQRMNGMFPPEITSDFASVSDHLKSEGWEVPELIPTKEGSLFTEDGDDWWRMMTFIESDKRPEFADAELYKHAGRVLAQFHGSMARLDHELAYQIPHFHETDYYAEHLREVQAALPDADMQDLAAGMLTALESLPDIPMSSDQILHGDPQTINMLFRDGKPFTLIDFDTFMRGPIWTDLGDMLRSLAEDVVENGGDFPYDDINAVINGYREIAAPEVDQKQFSEWAMIAIQKLSLELGMRFVADTADSSYFGYDPSKFSSSRESNVHRAHTQWKLYESAKKGKES